MGVWNPSFVVAGHGPAIHVGLCDGIEDVDARDKPAHDGGGSDS